MKLLIADDDAVIRQLLSHSLGREYEVTAAKDGHEAWECMSLPDAPGLLLLDWTMPGVDGVELCRRVRALAPGGAGAYIILLTGRDKLPDVVQGLSAGADDYVKKPFQIEEVRARLRTGCRILGLQDALATRVRDLETALADVKRLRGLLPICSYCKSIRNDENYWQQLDVYVSQHSDAQFSHGVCPRCYDKHIKPELDAARRT
jgi:DNA-binding response OmpR family regulator